MEFDRIRIQIRNETPPDTDQTVKKKKQIQIWLARILEPVNDPQENPNMDPTYKNSSYDIWVIITVL